MAATRAHEAYWPALDGIRALAVSAVIAYHLGHLPGGWIGVDVFFVLSGYLITTLLLRQEEQSGSVVSLAFWGRRARRLLPAVFLLLATLAVYAWAGGSGLVPAQLRAPALGTFFYVANWQELVAGNSYFAQFTAPSPLTHTWSLAIEEQYYVLWPFLLAGALWCVRGIRQRKPRVLPAVTMGAAVASVAWMGVAANVISANRAYLGTDTRAWELLVGGAAAMLWPAGQLSPKHEVSTGRLRRLTGWSAWAGAGLAGLGVIVALAGGPPNWIWDGGLAAAGICSAALIVGTMRSPASAIGRILGFGPLPWVGRLSYSLYLWHWPVIVLLNQDTSGLSGWELLIARLATMTAASCVSYYAVERPLRRADWSAWRRRALAPVGAGVTAGLVVLGTVSPASAGTAAVVPASHPSAPSAEQSVPAALPFGRQPSASDPLRVWLFGDSVMYDGSAGLTAALQATGDATVTANSSFGGWGLSTDRVWPSDEQRIVAEYHPEVAIGTWSWDDQLAMSDPTGYGARLHDAVADILTPGNGVDLVVILKFPPQGPNPIVFDPVDRQSRWIGQLKVQSAWDHVAEAVAAQFPGHAAFLDVDEALAPGGRFMTWMPVGTGHWVRARKLDNTHMCPYGAALFGAAVVAPLQKPLGLGPLSTGWEHGAWVQDPRYNDPPGACPDDQPPLPYSGTALPTPVQLAHTSPGGGTTAPTR